MIFCIVLFLGAGAKEGVDPSLHCEPHRDDGKRFVVRSDEKTDCFCRTGIVNSTPLEADYSPSSSVVQFFVQSLDSSRQITSTDREASDHPCR